MSGDNGGGGDSGVDSQVNPENTNPENANPENASVTELFAKRFAASAGQGGFGAFASGQAPSRQALLGAMGGVRGLSEAVVPALVFIVAYTILGLVVKDVAVPISLAASVLVAGVFVVLRVAARSRPTHAVAGLIGVAASAVLAILTDKPVNNFLLGLGIDALYGLAFLISILVRWPLIGLVVGFLLGDGVAWRKDRLKARAMMLASLCWLALFALRLIVQLPFYFAQAVTPLAISHLVMGVPLYVPLLIVTWFIVRSVYPQLAKEDSTS